jgi:hypothetical protein
MVPGAGRRPSRRLHHRLPRPVRAGRRAARGEGARPRRRRRGRHGRRPARPRARRRGLRHGQPAQTRPGRGAGRPTRARRQLPRPRLRAPAARGDRRHGIRRRLGQPDRAIRRRVRAAAASRGPLPGDRHARRPRPGAGRGGLPGRGLPRLRTGSSLGANTPAGVRAAHADAHGRNPAAAAHAAVEHPLRAAGPAPPQPGPHHRQCRPHPAHRARPRGHPAHHRRHRHPRRAAGHTPGHRPRRAAPPPAQPPRRPGARGRRAGAGTEPPRRLGHLRGLRRRRPRPGSPRSSPPSPPSTR